MRRSRRRASIVGGRASPNRSVGCGMASVRSVTTCVDALCPSRTSPSAHPRLARLERRLRPRRRLPRHDLRDLRRHQQLGGDTVAPSPHHHSGSRCPGPRCSKAVYDTTIRRYDVLQYRHIFIGKTKHQTCRSAWKLELTKVENQFICSYLRYLYKRKGIALAKPGLAPHAALLTGCSNPPWASRAAKISRAGVMLAKQPKLSPASN